MPACCSFSMTARAAAGGYREPPGGRPSATARRQPALSRNVTWAPAARAHTSAVISSPDSGVFAVTAGGVLCAFPVCWTHYLNSVSAAEPAQASSSLRFSELSDYYVNAIRLHVTAADALVRLGVDRDDF